MRDREISHHNSISQGKLEDFELRELKLFLALMSDVEKNKSYYEYSHLDIKKFIGMGDQSLKSFSSIIKKLQKRVLIVSTPEKEINYSIFTILVFNHKNKTVEVEYSPRFFPLISDFKGNFCKYKLKYIEPLTSKYSVLFYMLFKSNQFKKDFSMSIEEINFKIGKSFRSDNLERRVLEPTIEEINKYTDINIEVIKERNGLKNKISGYKFIVSKKIIKVSNLLEKAIKKAKRNIYINKSKMLNDESIQILLSEISENDLINGLNYAYIKINKEFKTLGYLKKVILSIDETIETSNEIEMLENKEVEQKENKELKENVILVEEEQENNLIEILKRNEEQLIEYLVNVEKSDIGTLLLLKKKSKMIYENTLKRAYNKIKKEL
ncbi:replication initiation protein [Cetobacterium sp. ZOR0034]|uniref:replication initiation protein n=1 Tax=Cetobacterium sp. ZOR0034 TaxID=1339239 RepID=UPI0006473A36|nr:replication initiation protein [Cetobacterium sp. ZOR0034]